MNVGSKVKFMGADDGQVSWGGGNDDPRDHLVPGDVYTITNVEMHKWHTKIMLKNLPNLKFNSVSFEDIE